MAYILYYIYYNNIDKQYLNIYELEIFLILDIF